MSFVIVKCSLQFPLYSALAAAPFLATWRLSWETPGLSLTQEIEPLDHVASSLVGLFYGIGTAFEGLVNIHVESPSWSVMTFAYSSTLFPHRMKLVGCPGSHSFDKYLLSIYHQLDIGCVTWSRLHCIFQMSQPSTYCSYEEGGQLFLTTFRQPRKLVTFLGRVRFIFLLPSAVVSVSKTCLLLVCLA